METATKGMTRKNDPGAFYIYVYQFYGVGGVYDMGATMQMIIDATNKYAKTQDEMHYDSVDRECVRDIIIADNASVRKFTDNENQNV